MPVILVVDDEPLIRWSLSEGLTEFGYVVRLASNAAEARAALASLGHERVVVLLDLRLPDSADLSLLREIRSKWPAAPVVMMSAHGSTDDVARAIESGAFRFVDKPFDVTDVAHLIGEAWARRIDV